MNKLMCIFLALMYNFSSALIYCDDIDPYIQRGFSKEEIVLAIISDRKAHYANECYIEGGLGSDYGYDGGWVPVCGDLTGSKNGYVKSKVSCDFCSANWVKQELKDLEDACREDCRTSNYICKPTDLAALWGGEITKINSSGGSCGAPLPNCSESSSSQDDESSSSEDLSSSSEESSSSVEESSSSENDENSSSSEEEGDSSSSENDGCDEEIEDCDIDRTGEICYSGHPNDCSSMEYTTFANRPAMIGDFYFYDYIMCRDGQIEFHANVPEVNFSPMSFMCKKEGCQGYHEFEGDWHCTHQDPPVDGCISDFYEIAPMGFHYNLQERQLYSFWGKVDFEHDSLITESKFDVAYFDVEELYNAIVKSSVYVYDDTGAKVSLGLLYTDIHLKTFDDYVYACAYHFGLVEKSSSSQAIASSSSSNDSLDIDWDYYFSCSSVNSVTTSSSEEINSSSSKEYDESSSSSEYVTSSNSAVALNIGPNQDYSPDQIFNEGLQNMEEGKCYSLNPDWGAQHGWINDNAQDTWWWREVDCETGKKIDNNRIGVCPGFPLDMVPDKPKRTCVAYNGKCYRCKSENTFVDCSQEWLWKWNFNEQNVGSWYEYVDCYNPKYESDVEPIQVRKVVLAEK